MAEAAVGDGQPAVSAVSGVRYPTHPELIIVAAEGGVSAAQKLLERKEREHDAANQLDFAAIAAGRLNEADWEAADAQALDRLDEAREGLTKVLIGFKSTPEERANLEHRVEAGRHRERWLIQALRTREVLHASVTAPARSCPSRGRGRGPSGRPAARAARRGECRAGPGGDDPPGEPPAPPSPLCGRRHRRQNESPTAPHAARRGPR